MVGLPDSVRCPTFGVGWKYWQVLAHGVVVPFTFVVWEIPLCCRLYHQETFHNILLVIGVMLTPCPIIGVLLATCTVLGDLHLCRLQRRGLGPVVVLVAFA